VGSFENEVLAVDLEGDPSILWRYKYSDRDFPFYSSPAVTDKLVIIGGRDKLVHAIDAKTGESLWTFSTKARIDSSPVIAGSRVYIASKDGDILGLDLESGDAAWRFDTGSAITASPAIANGRLVISTLDGLVYAFARKAGSPE